MAGAGVLGGDISDTGIGPPFRVPTPLLAPHLRLYAEVMINKVLRSS
jgi:hypothetical protein